MSDAEIMHTAASALAFIGCAATLATAVLLLITGAEMALERARARQQVKARLNDLSR